MKLKNIFTALLAGLTLFTACDKNEDLYLSEVRVSSSYVAIPIEGGNQEITITANDSWSINLSDKDAKWLTVSPVSGAAGDTKVVFSAAAGTSTNSTTLKLVCAGRALSHASYGRVGYHTLHGRAVAVAQVLGDELCH